jgi:hypothetical protein
MRTRRLLVGLGIILILGGVYFLADLSLFRSPIILEATLEDDRTQLNLYPRQNQAFELVEHSILGERTFHGKYQVKGNQLIFLTSAYENEIIPDTVTILGDKIILRTNWKGEPSVEYGSYFQIEKNEIKKMPS